MRPRSVSTALTCYTLAGPGAHSSRWSAFLGAKRTRASSKHSIAKSQSPMLPGSSSCSRTNHRYHSPARACASVWLRDCPSPALAAPHRVNAAGDRCIPFAQFLLRLLDWHRGVAPEPLLSRYPVGCSVVLAYVGGMACG